MICVRFDQIRAEAVACFCFLWFGYMGCTEMAISKLHAPDLRLLSDAFCHPSKVCVQKLAFQTCDDFLLLLGSRIRMEIPTKTSYCFPLCPVTEPFYPVF